MLNALLLSLALVGFNADHRAMVMSERYEEAIAVSKLCKPRGDFHFFQAVAQFKVKDYEAARQSAHSALRFNDLPERYKYTLERMQEEIDHEWPDPAMQDISTDMDNVQRRLRLAKAGPKTQAIQREIVRKLDAEIKKAEDAMAKASAAAGGGSSRVPAPAGDSHIMNGAGKDDVSNKKIVASNETWGKMPEKERVKALEAVKRQLPPHIREAAEGFSKKLRDKQ